MRLLLVQRNQQNYCEAVAVVEYNGKNCKTMGSSQVKHVLSGCVSLTADATAAYECLQP